MARSQRITDADCRQIWRILSDLQDVRHDTAALHLRLADGMTQLIGGTCGLTCDVEDWRIGGKLQLRSITSDIKSAGAATDLVRGMAESTSLWDDPNFVHGARRNSKVVSTSFRDLVPGDDFLPDFPLFQQNRRNIGHHDHLVAWHRFGPAGQHARILAVHRWKRDPAITARDVKLGQLVCEQLEWMYSSGRLDAPKVGLADLPPRLREIRAMLGAGLSPKRIATELNLSVYTVRDHIKRLYARAGVSDRGAFMALLNAGTSAHNAGQKPPILH